MNKNIFFLFFLIILISCTQNNKEKAFSCSYYGLTNSVALDKRLQDDLFSFSSNIEAINLVEEILSTVGLVRNFEIVEYNSISNAAAIVHNKKRYILYNKNFMELVESITSSKWSSTSILAHEIGHHLQGHTISEKGSRPQLELEADKFSGFIIGKLGGSLEDAQEAILTLTSENGSDTHPPKSERLIAIGEGFKQAYKREKNKDINLPILSTKDYSESLGHFIYTKLPCGVELSIPEKGCEKKFIDDLNNSSWNSISLIFDRLTFPTGSAEVDIEKSNDQLNNIVKILNCYKDINIVIEGHSDSTGSERGRLLLTQARADNIGAELVQRGINRQRVKTKGYSSKRPLWSNETKEGRAANRRIELRIW